MTAIRARDLEAMLLAARAVRPVGLQEALAVEQVRRLMRLLPHQNDARGVEVALRSFARAPRTWS